MPVHPAAGPRRTLGRTAALAATAALVLALAGCGGGGSSDSFYVTAYVDGTTSGTYGPNDTTPISLHAGQAIELDAAEPVVWTLYVGNTAVSATGATVQYGNALVTLSAESDSRILVDTGSVGPIGGSVGMTLVATSTYDSAQVAVVDVFITD